MEVKYKGIRERLKKHIEDSNGEGAWRGYYGSRLEADIVRFIEKEQSFGKTIADEQRDIRLGKFEEWLSTFSSRNGMYDFTDSLSCCRNSMRDKYNDLGIGEY